MKLRFTAEDFKDMGFVREVALQAARFAQDKLDKYLQEHGVTLYGIASPHTKDYSFTSHWERGADTHKGILLQVEELEKECDHIFDITGHFWPSEDALRKCKLCEKTFKFRCYEVSPE
jgi:hypothetical protein